ncbi:PepSY domain-containing protein [Joostella atrarenae]|uniref:PepSY domain-containing protein n=1 Tax=Joostella atrarenae TaxID=679257 RepID=A0ABS9J037_9FLAO|nr:PepSY-associated TM helix domain-containing protein [Joostella atrarenae]MCF8713792.1 PepSY domain-containing protein [Joostella atrarenae]
MNNRVLLKYHSYFGIIAGIILFALGITGSVLVFTDDIDLLIFEKYEVKSESEALQLDKAISEVQREFPEWSTRIIKFEKGKTILFNLRRPEARKYAFVDPATGKITNVISATSHFTKWILKFHYSLHAGITGRVLIFIAGIAFFLSLITGIILYRKVIIKTLLFKIKVKSNNKRNYYSALHRYVGVWSLLLNLVIVFTGVFLAYKVVTSGLKKPVEPTPPTVETSMEAALKNIKKEHPDFTPTYLRLPSSKEGSITVNGIFKGDSFYLSEYYNKISVDYKTGELIGVNKIEEADFSTKFNSSILPLHYGQYGGIFSKVLYCLIGLSGQFLSITGYFIWLKRKKLIA